MIKLTTPVPFASSIDGIEVVSLRPNDVAKTSDLLVRVFAAGNQVEQFSVSIRDDHCEGLRAVPTSMNPMRMIEAYVLPGQKGAHSQLWDYIAQNLATNDGSLTRTAEAWMVSVGLMPAGTVA